MVDLTISPGFDDAHVNVIVDGQKLADNLRSPYHVTVDFGPGALEHKITVIAYAPGNKKVQWSETINRGHLPLSVKVHDVDLANRVFEASVTTPADDPVDKIEFWENGKVIASLTQPPYRFAIPAENFQQQFVQVTAKTKSGDEAADFWSGLGDVHAESVEVRTVPLFVSVVDRNGVTHDDVDRSLFRVIDNGSEGTILEFGKAFNQPISIALLIDASFELGMRLSAIQAARQTRKRAISSSWPSSSSVSSIARRLRAGKPAGLARQRRPIDTGWPDGRLRHQGNGCLLARRPGDFWTGAANGAQAARNAAMLSTACSK